MKLLNKLTILFLPLVLYSCCNIRVKENGYFINLSDSVILRSKEGRIVKVFSPDYIKGKPKAFRDKNNLFITSLSNGIIKISLEKTKITWKKLITSIPQKNLVFDDKNIYFTTIDNKFYILDYDTGETKFIYYNYATDIFNNSIKPILYKNFVIVTFDNGEIIIFNKNTRKIIEKLHDKSSLDENSIILENNILKTKKLEINLETLSVTK